MAEKTAYIILENGEVFEGKAFGAVSETIGELVFTTSMVGYSKILTDQSHYGQVVVQTFPLIGNYGMIPAEFESSRPGLKAYIVREWCQEPSNFRSEGILDTFLAENNIPGVFGVDTREITRIVRDNGTMNCMITYDNSGLESKLVKIREYKIKDAVKNTTILSAEKLMADDGKYNIVMYDFGARGKIAEELKKLGCSITLLPAEASAEDVLALNPDGIILSNGPGNPADNQTIIEEIKTLIKKKIPIFGICLGHQLLALACGGKTDKLKYGHRGGQPVKNLNDGKVRITEQSHGYVVDSSSLGSGASVSYVNVNDGTCEGICYNDFPGFGVQFRPEAELLEKFLKMIEK